MPRDLEIVRRSRPGSGFQVPPQPRAVECTWGWLNLQRLLSKDCESLCETPEAWILAAITGFMLRRLARSTLS